MNIDRNKPNLSDEELLTDYRSSKNISSRNVLVERYSYISQIIAKKFLSRGAEYDDLYQIGILATIKAIDRFDEDKNVSLATFLSRCIAGEIKNYFRDKHDVVKISRDTKTLLVKINKLKQDFSVKGEKLSIEQAAKSLDVTTDKIIEAMESEFASVSLDDEIKSTEMSLYEIIPDKNDYFASVDNRDFFDRVMAELSETEQKFIKFRFIDGFTQMEIAKEMNVSQMLISRMGRKTMEKLRKYV